MIRFLFFILFIASHSALSAIIPKKDIPRELTKALMNPKSPLTYYGYKVSNYSKIDLSLPNEVFYVPFYAIGYFTADILFFDHYQVFFYIEKDKVIYEAECHLKIEQVKKFCLLEYLHNVNINQIFIKLKFIITLKMYFVLCL